MTCSKDFIFLIYGPGGAGNLCVLKHTQEALKQYKAEKETAQQDFLWERGY